MAAVGKRRRAREMAVQMLYQRELGGSPVEQVFEHFDVEGYLAETDTSASENSQDSGLKRQKKVRKSFEHACHLVSGTLEHTTAIDELIRQHAENWRLERMPTIDRNILRLAVFEMLHEEGVPKVVIVDEAIELAKKFGSEHSGRFVNGLLDGILQSDRKVVSAADGPT